MSKSSNNFLLKLFIGDRILWSCTVVLCLFSILVSYSATSQFVNRTGNSLSEVVGHTLFIVIGFLMAILIHHRLSKRWLKRLSAIIFGVAAVMLLMITFPSYIPTISFGGFTLFGPGTVNSATRWVIICGAMLQPSELAKMGLMGMLSYLLTSVSDVRIQKFSDWLAKVFNRESIDAVAVKWWMSVIMILFVCVLITLSNMSTG